MSSPNTPQTILWNQKAWPTIDESVKKRGNESGNKPDKKSGNKPDNESGNKPDNESGNKPDKKSGNKPDKESGNKPDKESDKESGKESDPDPDPDHDEFFKLKKKKKKNKNIQQEQELQEKQKKLQEEQKELQEKQMKLQEEQDRFQKEKDKFQEKQKKLQEEQKKLQEEQDMFQNETPTNSSDLNEHTWSTVGKERTVGKGRTFDQNQIKKPCAHFKNGSCIYGDGCYFEHSYDGPNTEQPIKKQICRHFAKGYCSYGPNCHFEHTRVNTSSNTEPIKKQDQPHPIHVDSSNDMTMPTPVVSVNIRKTRPWAKTHDGGSSLYTDDSEDKLPAVSSSAPAFNVVQSVERKLKQNTEESITSSIPIDDDVDDDGDYDIMSLLPLPNRHNRNVNKNASIPSIQSKQTEQIPRQFTKADYTIACNTIIAGISTNVKNSHEDIMTTKEYGVELMTRIELGNTSEPVKINGYNFSIERFFLNETFRNRIRDEVGKIVGESEVIFPKKQTPGSFIIYVK